MAFWSVSLLFVPLAVKLPTVSRDLRGLLATVRAFPGITILNSTISVTGTLNLYLTLYINSCRY